MILWLLTLSMFIFTLINLSFLRPLADPGPTPATAVCIPMRNESRHVERLILNLKQAIPEGTHVYIYEDRSEDDTYEKLNHAIGSDTRFTVIQGVPLPHDWAGKVHACHQLALRTTEPYLLFLDADVTIDSSFIARMHTTLAREQAVFLSGFPQFPTSTFLGKLLIDATRAHRPTSTFVLA